ncbi:glutathione S-transferase family protein [Variovorax rhizosphaerae]|uniref:Glutathione S-transferase family protein n=1 Tax=Variovorax rhizosphaerae TaxID=1836200 RepID=A0ABU8WXP8_9BURK
MNPSGAAAASADRYTLYGAPGTGATPVHAALTLIGAQVDVVNVAPWKRKHDRDKLAALNAMQQVPVLVLPSGERMTESAAILVWLADHYPEAGLSPQPGDPGRAQYLRWMSFVSSAIYALYWIRDEPSRLSEDEHAQAEIRDRTAERIATCWQIMDAQMPRGTRYLLGDELGVLDLYVTVVSRWQPRRLRFYREAPRMAEVVRRVDAEPRLTDCWAARFPFTGDWEG